MIAKPARRVMRTKTTVMAVFVFLAAFSGAPGAASSAGTAERFTLSVWIRTLTAGQKSETTNYRVGRSNYTMMIDGLRREYIVSVPPSYNPNKPTPAVFVFHGSAHDGGSAYREWKWREQCDRMGCIAVFPTSWRYDVSDEGRTMTKWNFAGLRELVPPNTRLADDVRFVREILSALSPRFNIDRRRIFATGGSNGAQFVNTRVLLEMPDVFAAVGVALVLETGGSRLRGDAIPLYAVIGSRDQMLLDLEVAGGVREFPMEASKILGNKLLGGGITRTLRTLGLDADYRVEYCDPPLRRCSASYRPALDSERTFYTTMTFDHGLRKGVELRYRMVKGMAHAYPNGEDNPARLVAAELFWDFFVKHPRD